MKCADCNKNLKGGFKFKEPHYEGHRCASCVLIHLDKLKGWQCVDQIFQYLRETKSTKLEGRKYKKYAMELKEQRAQICEVIAIYRAQKPVYLCRDGDSNCKACQGTGYEDNEGAPCNSCCGGEDKS